MNENIRKAIIASANAKRGKTYEEIYGPERSAIVREKASRALRGHSTSQATRNKISKALKGHPVSEKSRKTLALLSSERTGPKSPQWKGGVTPKIRRIRNSKEFDEWRLMVFGRDNFTCQICFERGTRLHAHHIMTFAEYPELRFAVSNGITLCEECHIPIKGHEKEWETYFTERIERQCGGLP